jgi:broad specificity phosphatase PhoE
VSEQSTSVEADLQSGSASTVHSESSLPVPGSFPAVVLIRHGETEWSRLGKHTGRTDVALTEAGEEQARVAGQLIRAVVGDAQPALVISSPRQRALRTAELAGFAPSVITEDAAEWDYGNLEGLTSPQIQQDLPDWTIWSGPVPGGEDSAAITGRIDRLLAQIAAADSAGPVLVFSHGHASRCVAARWLGESVSAGRYYWLGTGAVASLGYEHSRPVVLRWNLDNSVLSSLEEQYRDRP